MAILYVTTAVTDCESRNERPGEKSEPRSRSGKACGSNRCSHKVVACQTRISERLVGMSETVFLRDRSTEGAAVQ